MKSFSAFILGLAVCIGAAGQNRPTLTEKDYHRAESFLSYNTSKYIDGGSIVPAWLPGDKFWYRRLTANGSEFILVDPSKGSRTSAFDQQKMAATLSAATGKTYTATMLPFQTFTFSPDAKAVNVRVGTTLYKVDLQTYTTTKDTDA